MTDASTSTKRVLVVEDEPDFSALVQSVLTRHGYDVTLAHNGWDALEKADQRAPDLVTLDLQMPQNSGLHFFRAMRSSEKFRHIPIIVITGITRDDKDMENLVRSFLEVSHLPPPEAYVEKPFDNRQLLNAVEQALVEIQYLLR